MGNNDAKEQLEVCKAEAVEMEAELEHLRRVARLHEEATENAARYAAVIEKANRATDSYNPREAGGWQAVVDRVQDILVTVDTAAVLRERDAAKWDEGFDTGHYTPSEIKGFGDAGPTCECKVNPYREEADRD